MLEIVKKNEIPLLSKRKSDSPSRGPSDGNELPLIENPRQVLSSLLDALDTKRRL
jgi:hypothetical protein